MVPALQPPAATLSPHLATEGLPSLIAFSRMDRETRDTHGREHMPNQPTRSLFRSNLGILAWTLLLAACGSDDPAPQSPAPAQPAAGSSAAAPADTLMAAIQSFVDSGSAQLELNCPCFVEMGAYKTVDECLM